MARTITEIAQEIKQAFMNSPILRQAYGLDAAKTFDDQFSEASLESNDIDIAAIAQQTSEAIMDRDIAEIQTIVNNNRIGTCPWYVQQAKLFQWSATESYYLVVDPVTGVISYNIVNAADRIITQAAYVEDDESGTVIVKVATGEPGALQPITDIQQLDLENYFMKIKIAGIKVRVVNLPADIIRLKTIVYYNRAYNVDNLKQAIIDSLNQYSIDTNFNGVLLRNAVIDAIQRVAGVSDAVVTQLEGVQGENVVAIDRAYVTQSGYFNFQQDDEFPGIELIPE